MATPPVSSMGLSVEPFIPARCFRVLTHLYDTAIALTRDEERHMRTRIEQAMIVPGHAVLDLGRGAVTLTRMINCAYPGASVTLARLCARRPA
jgi:hypothetical protein